MEDGKRKDKERDKYDEEMDEQEKGRGSIIMRITEGMRIMRMKRRRRES
jgi:hypothetical protein